MSRGGENEDPAWLTESSSSAAAAVASNKEVQNAVANAATEHAKEKYLPGGGGNKDVESQEAAAKLAEIEAQLDPDDLAMMKKFRIALRVGFGITGGSMTVTAVFRILTGPDIETFFLAMYVIMFSIIMWCFECGLPGIDRLIATNFGFLYSMAGRIIFTLFVGVMCLSLGIWGIVCGSAMFVMLLFNVYVLCAYPKFEAWLRTLHYHNTKL